MVITRTSTAFLPLDEAEPLPLSPAFLVPSPDPTGHVKWVIKTILKARRIVVVCGAGISVQAGIPDFRSSEGLFRSLKNEHSGLTSGKDLFDASVFISKDMTSLFCQMIARLSQLSEAAEPTTFHQFLRVLDDRHRLLRVYTQNIDALEEKSGLTFGIPEFNPNHVPSRSSKGKAPLVAHPVEIPSGDMTQPPHAPSSSSRALSSFAGSSELGIPKCIPLHGTLRLMHCMACAQSYPLRDYINTLASGTPPPCPQCTALEEVRRLVGKRSHGVGKLRPSVVLYNEEYKDGEEVGNVFQKDLTGCSKGKGRRTGADLLLVAGTSLRIPGIKRIVQEFSKAVRSLPVTMNMLPESVHQRPGKDGGQPIRTIYLNLDFPVPTKEWEGVFDVWVRGDAQVFARMVHEELEEVQVKEVVKERKRKREEDEDEGLQRM